MGTPAPTLNTDTSNNINHHVEAGKVQINDQAGQAKRKRDNGASNDILIPKVKRINDVTVNDYNTSDSDCSDSTSDSEPATVNDNINSRVNIQSNNKRSEFQPPIVVSLNDKLSFINVQSKIELIDKDTIFKCNGKQVTLLTVNIKVYTEIIQVLKIDGIKFYTYTRKTDIKPKIILKGLPVINTELFNTELLNVNIKIDNINLLRNKNNNNTNQATYLITVNNNDKLEELFKIKHLFNIIIHWEKYKKNLKSTQCYNCQRHGHGQENCYYDPRCLKCAGIHPTKVCDVENTPKNYKCANCGNNHKANDINCQVYINYLQNNKIKAITRIKNSGDIT